MTTGSQTGIALALIAVVLAGCSGSPKTPASKVHFCGKTFLSNTTLAYCSESGAVDLSAVTGLKNLRVLTINADTKVRDLRPLAGMNNLQELSIYTPTVEDLRPLTGLTNLQELGLRGTGVRDLRPLAALLNIRRLRLSETRRRGARRD